MDNFNANANHSHLHLSLAKTMQDPCQVIEDGGRGAGLGVYFGGASEAHKRVKIDLRKLGTEWSCKTT